MEVNGELVPNGGGDPIPLLQDAITIGRRSKCDVRLEFPNVSNVHCEFRFDDGYWYVRDLNSTNGVKVNGTRVQDKMLHPGDEITIGKRAYVLHYSLPAGKRAREEIEEDVLSQSLLERAGLERAKKRQKRKRSPDSIDVEAADFLLDDED